MGVLTILEVSKKQHYIFKTNRLKENIGASKIIDYITEKLPKKLYESNNGKHISTGGGSSIFYFESEEDSINFSKEYSLELLEKYPSLEFFLTHAKYDCYKDKIIEKIGEVLNKLEKKKSRREQYSYITDFGICEKCSSTRLPAIAIDSNSKGRPISAEVKSKIEFNLEEDIDAPKYAVDIVDLGIKKNEKSYIAITHIDGNMMGKRVKKLREEYMKKYNKGNLKEINEEYVAALNKFSNDIKNAFEDAFNKVVNTIKYNIDKLIEKGMEIDRKILPIRKVVLAGDDVCYITDARIALECANIFIKELEKKELMGEKITACAGIAMVKDKYPFFRTYKLSEKLCSNAKKSISQGENESRMDWHIVQGEYDNNLDEIRELAYKTYDNKELSQRPLVISEGAVGANHYCLFRKDMEKINDKLIANSKIKGMLNEMKKGEKELNIYIEINKLYKIIGDHRGFKAKTGFEKDKCIVFDAIEAMDYFISLMNEGE